MGRGPGNWDVTNVPSLAVVLSDAWLEIERGEDGDVADGVNEERRIISSMICFRVDGS